jgi:L-lactate utilization protein LutC
MWSTLKINRPAYRTILVMPTRPGQTRSVSLVPSIHVAVITPDQIIAVLKNSSKESQSARTLFDQGVTF